MSLHEHIECINNSDTSIGYLSIKLICNSISLYMYIVNNRYKLEDSFVGVDVLSIQETK